MHLARCALVAAALCACERPRTDSSIGRGATTTGAVAATDTVVRRVARRTRRASAIQRVTPALHDVRALVSLDSLLVVRVYDQRGAELRDVPVSWTGASAQGATLRVINDRTDTLGLSRARFTPGAIADTQHVLAAVADVGQIDFAVVVPVAQVRVRVAESQIWADDDVAASAELRDATGRTLSGGVVSWASTDSGVARVRSRGGTVGLVSGVAAGETRVVAWTAAGKVQDSARLVVRPAIHGRVVTLDGREPPPMRLEVRSEGVRETLPLRDATFDARIAFAYGMPVEFIATPVDASAPYHAADVRVHAPRELGSLRIALVPTVWRIDAGTYQGRDVPIDANRAMQRTRGPGFWRLVPLSGTAPRRLLGWAERDLPLHLAFDRRRSVDPITAADSVAFWTAAQQMERDLGMRLFMPADIEDSARVFVVPVEVGDQNAEGHTFLTSAAEGDATDGVVLLRRSATLRDSHVVTHELLHLLGFGHTEAWPTVSVPAGGSEPRLTVYDVAYAQLAYRLRRAQRETGARPGLPVAAP